ncbi:hypothetical protein N7468_003811 [Penicillium chermesinum]|uniref:Uncharacterized protein n=1 Tax=Penicillium chermesinum TaxID=63820 RepID=A0A9W9P7F9_9EURO|nr:uncharacterized protein N7468_003811 [Penicillium chermesinum]KAJ5239192.1 hypothetical protein N7468_003811 [Penicillium chermesinum]KAJ6164824.1 hypothetical protein N7470_003496 [Penicillium chermesinum]
MAFNIAVSPSLFREQNHDHPWTEPLIFDFNRAQRILGYVDFAFECLSLVAVVTFFACTCVMSNSHGRLKGLAFALFSWALWDISSVIPWIFSFARIKTSNYFNIDFMAGYFFFVAASCFVVFVLYSLAHGFLDRLADAGRPFATAMKAHWVVLGFLVALSLADWGLFVAYVVLLISEQDTLLAEPFAKLDGVRACIFCAIAIEILLWSIYIAVKASSRRFASKVPPSLILAALSWFGFTVMYCIIGIRFDFIEDLSVPDYQSLVMSVCEFVFCVGLFVGIILCLLNWRQLQDPQEKPAAVMHESHDTAAQIPAVPAPEGGPYRAYQASHNGSASISQPSEAQRQQV